MSAGVNVLYSQLVGNVRFILMILFSIILVLSFSNSVSAVPPECTVVDNCWNVVNSTGPNIVGGPFIGGNAQ
ncbi:MAG: hypothetical protein R6U44_02840 [Archaeoglobaceae archaeon]